MKKIILSILTLCTIGAIAQTKKVDPVASFEKTVAAVQKKLESKPEVLVYEAYANSKTGFLSKLFQPVLINTAYDVQATNSLISPYTGYILLTLDVLSNETMGDVGVSYQKEKVGYSDSTAARANKTFVADKYYKGNIKVNYAFQNNKWIFKNVDAEIPDKIFMGILRDKFEKGFFDQLFK